MTFKTIEEWKVHVLTEWNTLNKQAVKLKLDNDYQRLIAIALLPVFPTNKQALATLKSLLAPHPQGKILFDHLNKLLSKSKSLDVKLTEYVNWISDKAASNFIEEDAVDWLLLSTGALAGAQSTEDKGVALAKHILEFFKGRAYQPSSIRVQAKMIQAGENVIFAGRDVSIVSQYYGGNKAALKSYVADVRAEWDSLDVGSIFPASTQMSNQIRLHQLFTPMDTWIDQVYVDSNPTQLAELRLRAIEQDLTELRCPALEAIATERLLVILGSPGTGKSTLTRFLATCLAYACDPDSEVADQIKGLELLGPSWINGAILPIYINLRNFVADKNSFPAGSKKGKAAHLLAYLQQKTGSFAPDLEKYLTNTDIPLHGTILLLDGLDEVYAEKDRLVVKQVIENWADRFPSCRILVTSRNYAYRQDVKWRLTERFKVVELAPYTWKQMQTYIHNWYSQAAYFRPSSFGGRDSASNRTDQLAKNLVQTILQSRDLWSLARQPLLLALVVLIHENNKTLPEGKAQLYEQTVELLHRWNPPLPGDPLHDKLAKLNLERVRASLQLVAFDLQRDHILYQKFPAHIRRSDLLDRLIQQQKTPIGLGAAIEDVLEYLATRNGILVSDQDATYRFLHLSIQEYLSACALIEQYDECRMPTELSPPSPNGWTFPENVTALLNMDAFRWREVVLFIGSILAHSKGQDPRWNLIEHLLPPAIKVNLSEGEVYRIYIGAEIWAENWLKVRLPSHELIKNNLIKSLAAISTDNRLDIPERARVATILGQLQTDS